MANATRTTGSACWIIGPAGTSQAKCTSLRSSHRGGPNRKVSNRHRDFDPAFALIAVELKTYQLNTDPPVAIVFAQPDDIVLKPADEPENVSGTAEQAEQAEQALYVGLNLRLRPDGSKFYAIDRDPSIVFASTSTNNIAPDL